VSAPGRAGQLNKRAAARLAAVQALYQHEITGAAPLAVTTEFKAHRLADMLEPLGLEGPPPRVDAAFFERLVLGAAARIAELDALVEPALAPGWSLDRCGYFLRATLRLGAFELAHCPDVPVRVVVAEHVGLAALFLSDAEAGFVNAVLDRLGRELRASEGAAP
jgi:N utilization substance protein B